MKSMKITFVLTTLLLISLNSFAQELKSCGLNDDPVLTRIESEFLNEYMNDVQRKTIDFRNKKIIFVTGNSAQQAGTKSEYFEYIKKWDEDGSKVATSAVELDEQEKIDSGGYDLIVTYWTKILTKRRKRLIIREAKVNK